MSDSKFYRTTHLPTAAWLLSQKLDFKGLQIKDTKSCWFIFSPQVEAEALANSFACGQSVGNIRDYADALRRAKDLVFDWERSKRHAVLA